MKTTSAAKRAEGDLFNEDLAELQFLRSKPTCFFIVGKSGCGKTSLAKKLAEAWHCQHIHGTEVIEQEIRRKSEIGESILEILLRGEALSTDFMVQLLKEKLSSPEVAHYGYVFDELPTLANDSSSVKDQLNVIRSCQLKPDFIINIKIPDEDLLSRKQGLRVDYSNGTHYLRSEWDFKEEVVEKPLQEELEDQVVDEDEEGVAEQEPVKEIKKLDEEIMERLIHLPEDQVVAVKEDACNYKEISLKLLEDYMSEHDRQHVIEVDGNCPVDVIIEKLLQKLDTYTSRRAVVPQLLKEIDEEESEAPQLDEESDELLQSLNSYNMPGPRYRWRASKWGKWCPVALKQGNLLQGRSEFAVSFMDKIYLLSSTEALKEFKKNPRPFLLPPQPLIPCKLAVLGPMLSGKSSLCEILSKRYKAVIFNLKEIMAPKLQEEAERIIEKTRQEAIENAIPTVQAKLEQEYILRKASEGDQNGAEQLEGVDEDVVGNEGLGEEEGGAEGGGSGGGSKKGAEQMEGTDEGLVEEEVADRGGVGESVGGLDQIEGVQDEEERKTLDSSTPEPSGPPVVTEDHAEVQRLVEEAIAEAKKQEVRLPVQTYIEALQNSMAEVLAARKTVDPDVTPYGGWILDGFPENRDQWSAMIEAEIIPDEYIIITDKSQSMEFISNRYFKLNETEIVNQYRSRLIAEKQVVLKGVEAELERIMEERREEEALEEAMREQEKEAEEKEDEAEEKKGEIEEEKTEDESKPARTDENLEEGDSERIKSGSTTDMEEGEKRPRLTSIRYQEESKKQAKLLADIEEIKAADLGIPPQDAPEFNQFKDKLRNFDKEFNLMVGGISNGGGKITYSEVREASPDEIGKGIGDGLDAIFGFQATEFSTTDAEDEEEDFNMEVDLGLPPNEEDEDEDVLKEKKKHFGHTKNFDPIMLKEDFVLWPGSSEYAAKYREKTYCFASAENRDKFIENPLEFLPQDAPVSAPPLRMLMLGPRGAGKTLQGRLLAEKLGIFHVSFRERLQELILHKVKHKVGPEHDDARLLRKELSVSVEEAVRKAVEFPGEEETEEEEEPDYKFNDEEDAIFTSLVDDDAIPVELLEKILNPLWKEEPFRSTGFILEGFPRTGEEAQFLTQNGLYPDIALSLAIDDSDVVKRILPSRMQLWKERRDMRMLKREKIREKKKEIRLEKMKLRRAELLNEQHERRMEALESGEEEEEDEDIDEILQAEFEDDEDEDDIIDDDEEGEDDVSDRMKTELYDAYETEVAKLQIVQEQLEEGMVSFVEISAKRKPSIVTHLMNKQLLPFIEQRSNLLQKAHPVSMELANKLLLSSYKHPSTYSKWDPVQVLDEGAVIPPLMSPGKPLYPVVFHHYVYFLSSPESRDKFVSNPLKYAFNYVHNKPVVPLQVAVMGPPKSGKTTLCERFARDYGAMRVSVGGCIRKILETQPETHLAKEIQAHLMLGEVVPDELAVEALSVVLLDTTCTTRGYALDGYPCTGNQMVLMNKRGILPVKIIELQIDAQEMLNRADKVEYLPSPLPYHSSDDILAVRYSCYCEHTSPLQVYYKKQHDNWEVFDGKVSKWKLWSISDALAKGSIEKVQNYLEHVAKGVAAPIAELCISPKEFARHLGVFDHYCPVCLNVNGELTDCSSKAFMKFAVEYRAKYYKMCCKDHMDIFMNSSEVFAPPAAKHALPPSRLLPQRRTREQAKALFPMPVMFQGYCPVAYADRGCQFDGLVEGDPNLVVQYRDGLFHFSTEKNLQAFMKTPEAYYQLQLPSKLPPKKEPMNLTLLPLLGYLEQGVSTSVIRALTEVGCLKPKFPFISVRRTALFFIACHLKAFNPNYSTYLRNKYFKKLNDFKNVCDVVPYLGDHMSRNCPISNSLEFDANMRLFLGHENIRPTRNWAM